jgi:DNA-binding NtrC family response regulator
MRNSILIVDDERAVLETLREYFEAFSVRVDCAEGLESAREKLVQERYGAVLADLQLSRIGDTQGLELADFVRLRCPGTAFVVLTGYGSHQIEREARRRGVSFFLHKPVRLEDLAQIVFGLLKLDPPILVSPPR